MIIIINLANSGNCKNDECTNCMRRKVAKIKLKLFTFRVKEVIARIYDFLYDDVVTRAKI